MKQVRILTACLSIFAIKGFLFLSLFSQNPPDKLTGFVLDATTKTGIPGVGIVDLAKGTGTITDGSGKFSFQIETYPARILFMHLSYFPDTLLIKDGKEFKKTYAGNNALLYLRTNVFEIGEVTVKANARKLFEKEPFAIVDYQ